MLALIHNLYTECQELYIRVYERKKLLLSYQLKTILKEPIVIYHSTLCPNPQSREMIFALHFYSFHLGARVI